MCMNSHSLFIYTVVCGLYCFKGASKLEVPVKSVFLCFYVSLSLSLFLSFFYKGIGNCCFQKCASLIVYIFVGFSNNKFEEGDSCSFWRGKFTVFCSDLRI